MTPDLNHNQAVLKMHHIYGRAYQHVNFRVIAYRTYICLCSRQLVIQDIGKRNTKVLIDMYCIAIYWYWISNYSNYSLYALLLQLTEDISQPEDGVEGE